MRNFRHSRKKRAYAYILTPKGLEEKLKVTVRFLKRKIEEYNTVSAEIARLTRELEADAPQDQTSPAGL
jgi:hypothetical protein